MRWPVTEFKCLLQLANVPEIRRGRRKLTIASILFKNNFFACMLYGTTVGMLVAPRGPETSLAV
jgi:hypothetical protein